MNEQEKIIEAAERYLSRQPVHTLLSGRALYEHKRMIRAFCAGQVAVIETDTPAPLPVFPSKEEIRRLAELALVEMQEKATTDREAWIASYEKVVMSYRRLALAKQQLADRSPSPSQLSVGGEAEKIKLLEDDLDDAQQEPWPEWAASILKTLKRYGYDPVEDDGTVDLAQAFGEYLESVDQASEMDRKHMATKDAEIASLKAALAAPAVEDYATRLFDLHGFMLLETYRGKHAVTVTFPDLEEAQQFHSALVELSTHRPRPRSLLEGSDNG